MSALSNRDTNIPTTSTSTSNPFETRKRVAMGGENKTSVHKNLLERKITAKTGNGQAYVSPSDAIMSPASQKLAGFKQKQINKNSNDGTRRSLFTRSASGSSEKSLETSAESSK